MSKEWRVLPKAPVSFINECKSYHPLIAQLLYNRGLQSQQQIQTFFTPEFEKLHDPFLFQDMEKAVQRIWRAVSRQEKIIIHGDYDADGVTSSAVVYKALKMLRANVEVFIPHRELDGYGINLKTANNFIARSADLIITVDCGITNVKEVERLNEAGIEVIITDHHEPPQVLPEAFAIIDPKVATDGYPFRDLSGAAVAYKLVQGLLSKRIKTKGLELRFEPYGGVAGFQKWLLDIVAIGVVADVMPLLDENRILVKWGLLVLNKTKSPGLRKLLELIHTKKIDSYTIGYQLAPRLNAAGRMKHASVAFNLLVTEDDAEAEAIAQELQENNLARQKVTEIAVGQAKQQLILQEQKNILFAFDPTWPAGVIGLIAGKLSDEFYRPVVAMTTVDAQIVGSGRSIEGYNITDALTQMSHMFARFGGHSQACGFTLIRQEILEEFKISLGAHATAEFKDLDLKPFVDVDAEINLGEINLGFYDQLEILEPFGEGNVKPRFLIRNAQVIATEYIGVEGKHLRLMVKQNSPQVYKMMKFGNGASYVDKIAVGDKLDIICEINKSDWSGRPEIEYKIIDLVKV
ncbi:MAG: Single-stranded-DNA-specific exonuclease RecJ [Parcubacteria group bacterium GW2011_GWC2_39_14]|nr:MAG: Single-stranded-DNA-specific exonuclease RecJ [Parcubacteria group bacterium GW2011_GWC2_39_14]KKR53356.1 MAG: Single-stranded-DNA-specific exonuclease RecJ [Parcubacteria group bacterium GW2011_GWA2_40_23]